MENYINEAIDDQAAKWAARSLSGDFSSADRQAMEKWREADERHRAALDDYLTIADYSAQALHEADSDHKVTPLVPPAPAVPRRPWFAAAPAIAASIAIALVFTVVFVAQPPAAVETYVTQKGEVSEIALADGSAVTLNTDTEVSIRYSKNMREVDLVRGEALFDVARNPDRPFVVAASGAQARVLGTRFNVHAKTDMMTVSVLSGRVEVTGEARDASSSSTAPVVLAAGREVTVYDSGRTTSPVRGFDPAMVASWRDGIARYENEELAVVVADLNRYFAVRIELGDDSLADIPVTGGFNLKNQEVAVEALSIALNLRAERRGSSEIVLLPHE